MAAKLGSLVLVENASRMSEIVQLAANASVISVFDPFLNDKF